MSDNMDVKVSVVLPSYNNEKTITRTLDSILRQKTDFKYEIIISDDASSDRTAEICRAYQSKYPDIVRLQVNEANKGILHNYYDAVLSARGSYISDIGGDDFWTDPLKLQRQADYLDNHPDVALVHTDWDYYMENSGELKSPWHEEKYPYLPLFEKENVPAELLRHHSPSPVHMCTAMYRASTFKELYEEDSFPFRNKDFLVEDLQLMVLMASKGRVAFIPVKTLAYSQNEESISGGSDYRKVFRLYHSSLGLTRYLEKKLSVPHDQIIGVYRRFIHLLTMQAFHSRDRELMNQVRKDEKDWDVTPCLKTRLIRAVSALPVMKRMARGALRLKHSFKK